MSRPLQLDDLVLITVNNISQEYKVKFITSNGIYISSPNSDTYSLLIPINNQWQVGNFNIPHIVTFNQEPRTFTGVHELDFRILLNMDYNSLMKICQTDKYLNQICQDDYLWRKEVERDFGKEVIKYKPERETYRQQYEHLRKVKDPNEEAMKGRLDGLIILEQRGVLPDENGANGAAEKGHLHILEWLEQRGILPDEEGANYAAMNEHLNVLEWLEKRGILPDINGANFAAENGHLHVLEWLEQRGILPNFNGANSAAMNGHLHILEWLEKRGILPDK